MVRIQDSQSWHRGSIPLSTTKVPDDGVFFRLMEVVTSSSRSVLVFRGIRNLGVDWI